MRRAALLVAVVSLLLLAPVAGAQAQATPATTDTQIHVAVQENGDARWSVAVHFPLETTNQTAAFEALRDDFTDGNAEGFLSIEPFREAADRVSTRTGQEMEIVAVERDTAIRTVNNTSIGQLRLSFTWTNFARIGEDEVQVGEAFEGGWFGNLGPSQTLLIEPPPGYKVHNVDPIQSVTNGTLRWDGPQSFGPGQPVVTFVPVPSGPLQGIPVWPLAALGVVLVAGTLAVLAWRSDWDADRFLGSVRPSEEQGGETAGSAETASAEGSEAPAATGGPDEEAAGSATPTATTETPSDTEDTDATEVGSGTDVAEGPEDAAEGTASAASSDEEETDVELLSDEERVERLLRESGGRMKQAKIVEETRWSNAKVSQLLSAMAEEDKVEKLRLGRENLITLPDEDEFAPPDEEE